MKPEARYDQPCSNPTHPHGVARGKVERETATHVFLHRICPVCGRSQGVARVGKE